MWIGVDLFFVLSGFLITGVLLDAKARSLGGFFVHFYERRARRILAPYLLMLFLTSLFVGVAWMQHWYLYILFTNLLFPLNIPRPAAFNPLWSLAVEEQFYLVWPFAVYFLNERRLRRLCIFFICLAPALRFAAHLPNGEFIHMLTPFRMDLLAAGGLLCIEWRPRPEWIQHWGARLGAILMIVGMAAELTLWRLGVSSGDNTRLSNTAIYEANLFLCFGFVIYALGGRNVKWLAVRPLRYIGIISYSMYLVHMGILLMVHKRFSRLPAAAIALVLTVAYSSLSWWLMESRLLKQRQPLEQLAPQSS
jgi:peptidoglycan/LPS O-acetylase OafA/YrhL